MKKTRLVVITLILFLSIYLTLYCSNLTGIPTESYRELDGINRLKINNSYMNLTGTPIFIDDSNPNYNWSKTAIENDWCSGSGTWNDPYVIEDVLIDGLDGVYCISIWHSDVFFIIRNCVLFNVGSTIDYAPIQVQYSSNGKVNDNILEDGQTGIYLLHGDNFTISNNVMNDLVYGMHIEESDRNTISNNDLETQTIGIYLENSNYNNVSLNNAIGIHNDGFFLSWSDYNLIIKNTIIFTTYGLVSSGIDLTNCFNTTIKGNYIKGGATGVYFRYTNLEVLIKDNIIIDNSRGINIASGTSTNNTIYNNCFIKNDYFGNAYDESLNNKWDNGSSGNYWDDYSGTDNDGDGIGNSPYNIDGPAGSSDNYPLMKCPFPLPQPTRFNWLPVILGIVIGLTVVGIGLALYFLKFRKPK